MPEITTACPACGAPLFLTSADQTASVAASSPPSTGDTSSGSTSDASDPTPADAIATHAAAAADAIAGGAAGSYTVQEGDSLDSIAAAIGAGVTADALFLANRGVLGSTPDPVAPGTVLLVPPPDAAPATGAAL